MVTSGVAQSRDPGAAQSAGRCCAAVEHATQLAEIAGVSPYLTGIEAREATRMGRKNRRRFTPEQKAQAVRIVRESGKTNRREHVSVVPSFIDEPSAGG